MEKLKIIDIEGTDYTLEDKNNKKYLVNLKFYIAEEVKIGNTIYLPKSVLKEVNCYAFGPINDKEKVDEENLIKLVTDKNEYFLERYYG